MASFNTPVLLLGALLAVGALLSGIVRRSFLSLAALYVVAGFVLGDGGVDVLNFDPRSGFVADLAIVALILILFRDGLEVDAEMLQKAWRVPLLKLVLAMPITGAIVAVAAHAFTSLNWTAAFLVGALLSPTDPVLSSSVVTDVRVPRLIRHSLNLESGLNDGLALAAVLAFAAALGSQSHSVWWSFLIQDISLGVGFGLLCGFVASLILPSQPTLERRIPVHQRTLFALGVAFATYGVTVLPPHGNGLIAVFVCAITLGIRRPEVREHMLRAEDIIELVKLAIFVVFGSLLTLGGLFGDGWGAVGIAVMTLFVARPVAVFAALAGTRTDVATKAFMSWFGPKGVATMTFSLLVLSQSLGDSTRIFNLAALTVFLSIILHGVTETPGVEWIARHAQRAETGGEELVAGASESE